MAKRNSTRIAPVIESPVVRTPKAAKTQACECGCGRETRGGRFLPGHDATLKSRLLTAFDAGDGLAGEELISRTWATPEGLAARAARGKGEKVSKADRLQSRVWKLDAKIAALNEQRAALVAGIDALAEGAAPAEPETTADDAA